MFNALYDSKPFTTYKYYKNSNQSYCTTCKTDQFHYYMKYGIFFGITFPLFPISTTYHKVCPKCCSHKIINSKDDLSIIKSEIKDIKPHKYNKYSQLDLDGYEDNHYISFGSSKELALNILMHIKDIEKNN